VAYRYVIGKDRPDTRAAGRQPARDVLIVELYADDERRRLDITWRNGESARSRLPAGDACKTASTRPVKILPGRGLKVTSTGWPTSI
jgi:hypothetical protein